MTPKTGNVRWMKWNVENVLEAIKMAQTFTSNEVYIKSPYDGKIHKVLITATDFDPTSRGIFDVEINEIDQQRVLEVFGDVYDLLKAVIGPG